MFMAPLPRGVKEYSHNDLETFPGTSFILKKNIKYPPPPTSKGTAINSEMCLCELGLYIKVIDLIQITYALLNNEMKDIKSIVYQSLCDDTKH